jgi:hypothetical protein
MNSIVKEKQYISNVLSVPFENLSQSYLQKGVALGTQSVIDFPVQTSQVASPLVTDNLLNLNDEFVVTHYTVFLRVVGADSPTNTQLLNALPITYCDLNVFTGTNAANVGAIYNGTLTFTIDRKDFIPAWPVRSFYRVPTTQTAANAYFTGSTIKTVNGFESGLYGFYQTEPVKITGRQTLNISIDLGASVIMDDSSFTYYAVLELRGYLLVNVKS